MIPQTISNAQLQAMLLAVKGARMATITMETEPAMRKTNNPYYGNVTKRTTMNITMNFSYENSVNNQRTKEGSDNTFQASPRKWGERIPGTCFVTHKGFTYMEVKANGAPQSTEYFLTDNGQPIAKADLELYLQEKSSNAAHQGVEKEIILRDIKITNIREIKINGGHFIVLR